MAFTGIMSGSYYERESGMRNSLATSTPKLRSKQHNNLRPLKRHTLDNMQNNNGNAYDVTTDRNKKLIHNTLHKPETRNTGDICVKNANVLHEDTHLQLMQE